jgi:hypothetical protein
MDIFDGILSKNDFIQQLTSRTSSAADVEAQWQRFVKLFVFHLTKRIAFNLPMNEQNTLVKDINPKNSEDINAFMHRTLQYVKTHPTAVNIRDIATSSASDTYKAFFGSQSAYH